MSGGGRIYSCSQVFFFFFCTVPQNELYSFVHFSPLGQLYLYQLSSPFFFFLSFTLCHQSFYTHVCLFCLRSDIPAVSLCPPDSNCATDSQLTVIHSEGELCDSCSSLGRPSSSCQLYHQVRPSTGFHCMLCRPLKQSPDTPNA